MRQGLFSAIFKKHHRQTILALLCSTILVSPAAAETPQSPDMVQQLRDRGATVTPLGQEGSLIGWYVQLNDSARTSYSMYVTEQGHAVVGALYDPSGNMLTGTQLANAQIPEIEAAKASALSTNPVSKESVASSNTHTDPVAALAARTNDAFGFTIGHAGPKLNVFVDPACPYSIDYVKDLRQLAAAGQVQAHIIPVAVLGEELGALRGIWMLGQDQKPEAWDIATHKRSFDEDSLHPWAAKQMLSNTDLHEDWKVRGVPFTVYENAAGQTRVFYRQPNRAADLVADAAGNQAQVNFSAKGSSPARTVR